MFALRFVLVLFVSSVVDLTHTTLAHAQERPGPVGSWEFSKSRLSGKSFRPLVGELQATVSGPIRFAKEKPFAIELEGDSKARHCITLTSDLAKAKLPRRTITAEGWVRVDRIQEWGGIVGALQDNGAYEKGWLLGYRNSRFCFAVSSVGKNQLTYMMAGSDFTPGAWYHVVGTYDGTNLKLYVDGKLVASSKAQRGAIAYPPRAVYTIGAYRDDNELYGLPGGIESINIWDRVLSDKEIQKRFQDRIKRFPVEELTRVEVKDWPTYRHDNERTGMTDAKVKLPLHLQWQYDAPYAPSPAWPLPAKQDFWNKRYDLPARVIYDRAYHVVTVGDRLYFGSSTDDKVYCLNAKTGHVVWTFSTEGPVRFAPCVFDEQVLVGSDDGHVYCLKAADGSLVWKTRVAPSDRRIPGNSRIISAWPIRTGVLVDGDHAFCCAGIFPEQGVHQAALDIQTGKIKAKGKVNVSAQGYLARKGNRLYVPTGRNPGGAFVGQLSRRGKVLPKATTDIPKDYPFSFIGNDEYRFAGGDGKVAGIAAKSGKIQWTATVDGKAHSLALSRGRLYVSTDKGKIYCFAAKQPQKVTHHERRTNNKNTRPDAPEKKGYALLIGGSVQDAIGEAKSSHRKIIVAHVDPKVVSEIRKHIEKAGFRAGQITVHHVKDYQQLPYADSLFNVVDVSGAVTKKGSKSILQSTRRMVRPFGGILQSKGKPIWKRGTIAGAGEWSHFYGDTGNTASSMDKLVKGPFQLQWFGPPGPREMIDRHHRTVAPLWKNGILFLPGNDRVVAVDSYNGTVLWKKVTPGSRRIGAYRDCSYLAAGKDSFFVVQGKNCLSLDAKTGKLNRKLSIPEALSEKEQEWGYVATVGNLVVGSSTKKGASRRDHSRAAIEEGTYFDARPLVCSDGMFVLDAKTGQPKWSYKAANGLIVNPTVAISDDTIYFVESRNPATLNSKNARATLADLVGKGADVVAIDLKTGSRKWRVPYPFRTIRHVLYLSYAKGKVVAVGSRNSGSNRKQDRVLFDILTLDAKTGKRVWSHTQRQTTGIGGSHGEQDHHPVIVGDKLFVEPNGYDLHTGKQIAVGWAKNHRRGCGTISASASTFFFRQSNPTMFDLEATKYSKVTSCTRPGCWINMIPAGGLLLVPEASSGCTCNYPVQTSMAFAPVEKSKE